MHFSTLVTYLASVLSNHLLKACTALPIKPLISASSFLGFKIRAHQCRGQRQCDKCRKHHGNGNGNGKLFIKLANRTAGKRSRDKYRGKYEGNGHNRAGNFAHGAVGCFFRRKASILNMMFYRFYNDDSVIDYEADSKDKCEGRQRINGKAQKYERSKSTNQRYRYCQQRNQRCAPAAEEHKDYKNNQYQRFQRRYGQPCSKIR